MPVRVLVTGFEPFGEMTVNPTQQLMAALAARGVEGVDLHTAVLPVEYDACLDALVAETDRLRPDAVIACGLAAGRTAVTPERIGINVKDTARTESALTDNAGRAPTDETIGDGPDGLFSTLPVRQIQRALVAAGVPSTVSNTAGTYICNNTMYGVLDHLRREGRDTLAGFVHFPASTEMAVADPRLPSLPLDLMERALVVVVETVAARVRAPVGTR